jgi:choline dehydrogenase-like flavoprotein
MKAVEADVLVIGAGIAGLATALRLARDREREIVVLTREAEPEEGSQPLRPGRDCHPRGGRFPRAPGRGHPPGRSGALPQAGGGDPGPRGAEARPRTPDRGGRRPLRPERPRVTYITLVRGATPGPGSSMSAIGRARRSSEPSMASSRASPISSSSPARRPWTSSPSPIMPATRLPSMSRSPAMGPMC